jgi:DHA1 family bicyclomycin/chloramphenicol resistance-like MFS transporter
LLGLACGQIVAGPLSDALGRRRPLLAGLVGYTLASLICATAPSVPVLVLLRLLQGMAGAAGIVIARAAVRDLFSGADVARFFSLTMLVNGLAPILAPVIGGQVLRLTSWRGVFVVLTVVGLLLVLSALLGLPETLPSGRRRSGGLRATLHTYRRLLADPALMRYSLASGLAMAAMFAYIAGSPFVIENLYGVSPQRFSLIFGTNAFGIVVLSQIGARLVARAGAGRLLAAGLGVSLLGSLLLLASVTLGAGLAGILPAFFLIVASIGLIGPNATALALADHPQTAGSASALIGVMQYIFGAVVAPLVGLGGMATAMPLAVVIVSLSVLANAIFVIGRGHD